MFKNLAPAETREIEHLFELSSSTECIIIQKYQFSINLLTFHRLKDGEWLNDDIINFYIELLREDSTQYGQCKSQTYFANTFFFKYLKDFEGNFCYENVIKWTKDMNIFKMKRLLFPLHTFGSHWALALIDMVSKEIHYIDSIHNDGTFASLTIFNMWLSKEYDKWHHTPTPFDHFKLVKSNCPPQTNCTDCGIFLLTYMHLIYLNKSLDLMDQSMAPVMRRKVAFSIARGILQVIS